MQSCPVAERTMVIARTGLLVSGQGLVIDATAGPVLRSSEKTVKVGRSFQYRVH